MYYTAKKLKITKKIHVAHFGRQGHILLSAGFLCAGSEQPPFPPAATPSPPVRNFTAEWSISEEHCPLRNNRKALYLYYVGQLLFNTTEPFSCLVQAHHTWPFHTMYSICNISRGLHHDFAVQVPCAVQIAKSLPQRWAGKWQAAWGKNLCVGFFMETVKVRSFQLAWS